MPIEFNSGSPTPAPDPARSRLQTSLFRMGLIVLPLLFVLLLKSLWFDTTLVISDSMVPTLAKGDYILTDHRLSLRNQWKRGDIVVFYLARFLGFARRNVGQAHRRNAGRSDSL